VDPDPDTARQKLPTQKKILGLSRIEELNTVLSGELEASLGVGSLSWRPEKKYITNKM
jgi:hypothetical protein